MAQEGEKLLVAMALLALGDDLSGGDVGTCGEQGGGAVTDVIVGDPFDVAQPHRQHRLGAVERLDLGFLVDTQHDGVVGRVEIEADDIAHLLDEEGVVGELEVALAVGLDGERLPALHGALGDAALLGHGAHAPMGGAIGRSGLERGVDDLGDPFIVMGSGSARAQFIVQPLDPLHAIALPPLANGGIAQAQAPGDRGVRLAPGAGENDLRTPHHSMAARERELARLRS